MRNLRNWERYPERMINEAGEARYEYLTKINVDAIRVGKPDWYGNM